MERLDKILSEAGVCSRKDCSRLARRGLITVNGLEVRDPAEKVDENAVIEVDGEPVARRREVVCIMNKPAGFVTSTEDDRSRTVMELLPEEMLRQKVVPAGRLDKDTEGLLVFTNNGDLLHRLISPKSEIPKTYYVEHEGRITDEAVRKAEQGVALKDGTVCKSAAIECRGEGKSTITITEGMYHQVKRMFAALGCHVTYLRRIQIGKLPLGDLEPSKVRELNQEEITSLFNTL
ncbi:MAG: rRNA pseudouridine synthase [Spirochaetales bacterium]|nr:rRNA pseudouridine synthase [Spirochaetales bacterium]